jgi:signal peptidase I
MLIRWFRELCRLVFRSAKIEVVTPQDPTDPSLPLSSGTVSEVPPHVVPVTEPSLNGLPVTDGAATVSAPADDPQHERPRSTIAEWTITILLLLFLTTTLVQAYVIPTGSMEDTLLIGDHLLVDKLAFAPYGPVSKYLLPYTDVKRGDIIVFRYPVDISQTFVKRCVGVPGDRIRVINKQVYLNGVRLDEPYTYHKSDYIDSYRDNFPGEPNVSVDRRASDMLLNHVVNGEVVVPPNSYFAMGDNRDSSLDSRYWGFVPRENIIGKPLVIYWSYDAPTDQLNTSSISMDHIVDLAENFFSKTRWRRSFMLIHGYPIK